MFSTIPHQRRLIAMVVVLLLCAGHTAVRPALAQDPPPAPPTETPIGAPVEATVEATPDPNLPPPAPPQPDPNVTTVVVDPGVVVDHS